MTTTDTTARNLTFNDLAIGDYFTFPRDAVSRKKTGSREYDIHYADGTIGHGVVGTDDPPVERIEEEDATQESLREHMTLVKELMTAVRTLVGFLDADSLRDALRDPLLREERARERESALRLLDREDMPAEVRAEIASWTNGDQP